MLEKLQRRESEGNMRKLTKPHNIIDFCSNDYLGFAKSDLLKQKIQTFSGYLNNQFTVGSTGSRLLSGNSSLIESLESFIAHYHNAETGLIFNSGFDANLGLFSSVPQKGDTILFDELIHSSIHNGMRISSATAIPFRHNNVKHLTSLVETAEGTVFIAVESVYSMDGDFAPLKEIAELANRHNANLIVDEAHSTGVFGASGRGIVVDLQLEKFVFARVYTFGKAMGCQGAIVVGSKVLSDFLINYAHSFIYTTALPFHTLVSIKSSYDLLSESEEATNELFKNILLFKNEINKVKSIISGSESQSPIQTIMIVGNENVKAVAVALQKAGFDVRPILSPTVPKGKERLRICIHSFNTTDEIVRLVKAIETSLN